MLLYANQLSIEKLKKHQDWSGKTCPNVLLKQRHWNEFKERVNNVLNAIHKGECFPDLGSGRTDISISNSEYLMGDKVKVLASSKNYVTGQTIKDLVKGSIVKEFMNQLII